MDSADDVQGLGEGVKLRVKKRNSSKSIRIQADSQLPVTCLQVRVGYCTVPFCCFSGLQGAVQPLAASDTKLLVS